ncbi:TPA: hypothetical protein N3A30_001269 [Salmonella enterica subsp. diarizonae serovar 57:c:e,n,x,z15]|nr:hypothetical protein [Salmonella enterica subsp. diarizonae serovar 57:c:e,n,x,z15]
MSNIDKQAQEATEKLVQERNALAAENAELNKFIAESCFVRAGEEPDWHPAINHSPETPATNQLSIEESQFLTDVMTAAGLLSCGKKIKDWQEGWLISVLRKEGILIQHSFARGTSNDGIASYSGYVLRLSHVLVQ